MCKKKIGRKYAIKAKSIFCLEYAKICVWSPICKIKSIPKYLKSHDSW